MRTIVCLKSFSGNPADGIDNVNRSVFSRISKTDLQFYVGMPEGEAEAGALVRLRAKGFFARMRLIRRMRPDYILGVGGWRDIAAILCKPGRTKYCIVWHTVLFKNRKAPWKVKTPWWIRRWILMRAVRIIAVSEYAAASLRACVPAERVVTVLNGVDTEFFNPRRSDRKYLLGQYQIPVGLPLVSFVGTVSKRKRPELVFEVARALPDVHFVLVGRNSDEYQIPRQLNIQWIQRMPREDVAHLFASSDALLFPSLHDAAAAVIEEALASGCPPLVSKSGGSEEFVRNGMNGYVVPVQDDEVEIFISALKAIVGDREHAHALRAAARVSAEAHDWSAAARKYQEVFQ